MRKLKAIIGNKVLKTPDSEGDWNAAGEPEDNPMAPLDTEPQNPDPAAGGKALIRMLAQADKEELDRLKLASMQLCTDLLKEYAHTTEVPYDQMPPRGSDANTIAMLTRMLEFMVSEADSKEETLIRFTNETLPKINRYSEAIGERLLLAMQVQDIENFHQLSGNVCADLESELPLLKMDDYADKVESQKRKK